MGAMIEVPNFISANFAIRSALGNINMPNIASSLSQDLNRWAIEAAGLISKKQLLRRADKVTLIAKNNKVKMCESFRALECVKINGKVVPYTKQKGCSSTCTETCQSCVSSCCDEESFKYEFFIKGCWIKFINNVEDGTKVEVEFWETQTDEDGMFLIHEDAVLAIAEYIAFMVKRKFNDSSYGAHEKRWYFLCKQARAAMNQLSDEDIRNIGLIWKPIRYSI